MNRPIPPIADKRPESLEVHGDVRVDDYYWLRERENPDVIAYLEAENAYTESVTRHTKALQDRLFEEIKGRIKQTDMSVPFKLRDYFYYTRYVDGKEYPLYCRKSGSLEAEERITIDVNVLADRHEYCSLRGNTVSEDQNILAYSVDFLGRRIYTIYFKDLTTGELYPDSIPDVTGAMAWANDNRTLYYAKQDPVTLRSYEIYRHTLGTDPKDDVLVYEETDETFTCYIYKTKSRKYLLIGSFQTLSHEYRYLEADNPGGDFKLFLPREREHEYDIDHLGDHFYIRTNWDAKNFRLMRCPIGETAKKHWEEIVPHRDDILFGGYELFNDFLVLQEREDGLIQIRIRPWSSENAHDLAFHEPTYVASIGVNPELDTHVLRFNYSSMTTPSTVYDYDMITRQRTLLKQEEVLGGFNSEDYRTERLHVVARDGVKVPMSIVYREDTPRDGTAPLLLYGYGSYGSSTNASFSSTRLSLLDRGFIYAIAHVRGGQEMGRHWYDGGKLFKKKNTFTDFIDCADYLVKEKFTSEDRLFAMGGSAGGLLIGAVINERPELFHGVVAAVPFVDVVTTMLDESIPLTTSEYDEWGNPNDKEFYDYIKSYSPYDNVRDVEYPHLLVTTGLHDSQVQYWEPAKWVAKLRTVKQGANWLLLKTNMEAGHGGASGRYKRYEELAFQYAFILDLAGIKE